MAAATAMTIAMMGGFKMEWQEAPRLSQAQHEEQCLKSKQLPWTLWLPQILHRKFTLTMSSSFSPSFPRMHHFQALVIRVISSPFKQK